MTGSRALRGEIERVLGAAKRFASLE